jgi:O-antigen/teichoic acid export membrane protein
MGTETQGRIKRSGRNMFFAAANYLVRLLLTFAARAALIKFLGTEYLGLNGLFTNILSVLSLAELGVGSAIVYALYKPVADGDEKKVNALIRLYRKVYFVIGGIIAVAGLALLPFLRTFIKGDTPSGIHLETVYLIFLANSAIGYFFAHRRALLFAHHRNDVETKINSLALILLNLAQIVVLFVFADYTVYVIALPIFTLLESLTVFWLSYRLFPFARGGGIPIDKEEKRAIVKNVGAMMCHKLGGTVVDGTDNILISSFLGLTLLGLYSNYTLIMTSVVSFFTLILTAVKSGVGNLLAEGDYKKAYGVFKAVNFAGFWFAGFGAICLFTLFQPFIALLGRFLDKDLLIDFPSSALLAASFFLNVVHLAINMFLECAGLFKQHMWKPVAQSIINLVVSIGLLLWIGLPGVILGTVVSYITTCFWVEPRVLYKYCFKGYPIKDYFWRYAFYLLVICAAGAGTYALSALLPGGGVWVFVAQAGICVIVPNLLFGAAYCRTEEFRYLKSAARSLLRRNKG